MVEFQPICQIGFIFPKVRGDPINIFKDSSKLGGWQCSFFLGGGEG